MPLPEFERFPPDRTQRRNPLLFLIVFLFILFLSSRYIASTVIEYSWWSELHQADTWLNLLLYGTGPIVLAALLFFGAFFTAFRLGVRHDGDRPLFGVLKRSLALKLAALVLALLAILVANMTVESWTVVKYFGGLRLAQARTEFIDPIFGKPLHFYFFSLPFYNTLLRVLLVGSVLSVLIYWLASNIENLSKRLPSLQSPSTFEFERMQFGNLFQSQFVRLIGAVFLLALAANFFLSRYDLLYQDHGSYLVGVDWVADHIVLPLQWLMILGAIAAAGLVIARQGKVALVLLLIVPVRYVLPPLVAGLYVRPNELALERPYIQHHIEATRSAYKLNQQVQEKTLAAVPEIPLDYGKHKALLDNVRLWDWRAFHDTVTQIQPLRPYVYMDTDVDRYDIDGQIRQVMLSPRELDIRQLGDARNRWINPHLIYTHGYGAVMAEANRITPDGLPMLFIKNAPPEVTTKSLNLKEPEIYYGEVAQDPVFVDTAQQEFNYPSGAESVYTRYQGKGGFSISSPLMRLAAALDYGDMNILLTSYLKENSRMMIHRPILHRLAKLAGFLTWDSDPYMVVSTDGRLVWMVDGYMSSEAHPYSRDITMPDDRTVNYMRNSVKATVDAYSGETNLYVFDEGDVLIQAYRKLFPDLFKPASAMPQDLRAHARYPETLFSVQAEMYRSFHMRDAESFYNKADLWDLAKTSTRQGEGGAATVAPTYVVATLPGESKPEFLLITPFTPANKANLIGFMSARCDGEHLGELVFQELSKQNIIYGPMQIDARINQDQQISRDLSLWNQLGSQVLRGQTLVLPIENSFLYVEPIYLQSSQTGMPQLSKVALAMGNQLAYKNTYEEALQQLIQLLNGEKAPVQENAGASTTASARTPAGTTQQAATSTSNDATQRLGQIRDHLQRYKDLSSQGKWADAGRELDEIQRIAQQR